MEFLIPMPAGNVRVPVAPRRSLRSARFAVGTSVAVHAALVAAAVLVPAYVPVREAPPITVDIVTEVMAPPEPAPEVVPPPPPPPAKQVVLKHAAPVAAVAAAPAPAATPTPAEEPTSETAPVVAATPEKTSGDGPAVLVATMPPGATGGGTASGGVGVVGRAPAPLTEAQRTSMIGRYRDQLRKRIDDRFKNYPEEARELELEGQVVVQVTIDKAGRLRGARLSSACPHPILCDDALRTIRAAAPFSQLPGELGESLQIDVPLRYDFQ